MISYFVQQNKIPFLWVSCDIDRILSISMRKAKSYTAEANSCHFQPVVS